MQTTLDVTAPTVEAAVTYVKDALPLVERVCPPRASVLPSFAAVPFRGVPETRFRPAQAKTALP